MKKYILPIVALMSMGFVSCSDDDDYTVGPQSSGCYFNNDVPTQIYFDESANEFELTLMRANDDEAKTYTLDVTDESGLFNIPNQVSFAAGDKSAVIKVTFDITKLAYVDYDINISIPADEAYIYGVTDYAFVAGIDPQYRWEDYGMCQYTDGLIAPMFTGSAVTYEVPIQRHMSTSGLYRLVNPYGEYFPLNEPGDYDDGMYYMVINAEYPNAVYGEYSSTGCDWGYGEFSVYSDAWRYLNAGYTLESVVNKGVCGKLIDGVITFPKRGWLLNMPEYKENPESEPQNATFWSNINGDFKIVLPGYY